MDKKALRKQAKDILTGMDDNTRSKIGGQLVEHLTSSNFWKQADTIGITVSGGFEWDTEPIIRKGWLDGKTIVVPKCIPDAKKLDFYQLENFDQLEESFFNLMEPNPDKTTKVEKDVIDLIIVPGLLYDKRGYRVGFGGGYYDRFLADFSRDTVSILYSGQLMEELPNEAFDVPVKHLITENGFIK
ncbi:5-formyltetrahydrofolate cyclo-ligase [Oceanobacillus luteolus]|uniref:5-formyltetrahydrofolate cyclo-ligase n=1 Tax=Oceanobacillus luteolus TaxID=1274358 RepID=A0ABW4HTB8_9BACI|nr:5-formyltetrahydrofolate cyclo-ligase [Oceanobacillus luteolus]MCM3739650.1 5-formyltetrahydrofolate cyclo-ligase [Oceanobacillus luteolus]